MYLTKLHGKYVSSLQRSSVRGVGKEKRFEVTVTVEETVVLVT